MTQAINYLSILPAELQLKIFSFIEEADDLFSVRRVDLVSNSIINKISHRTLENLKKIFPLISEKIEHLHQSKYYIPLLLFERFGSYQDREKCIYHNCNNPLYRRSNKSLPFLLLFKIISDLTKKIYSTEDGKSFLEKLQNRDQAHEPKFQLQTSFKRAKQIFEWNRDEGRADYCNKILNLPMRISFERAKQMFEWERDKDLIIFCKNLNLPALNDLIENTTNEDLSEKAKRARTWIFDEVNQHSLPQTIRSLDLKNSKLTLPSEIGQLTALQQLFPRSNYDLTYMPLIPGNYYQLLFLEEDQITSLPTTITELMDLKTLYLWGGELTSLPPEIGQLTALKDLHLWGHQLTSLPKEIGQLKALERFDLRANHLTSLPPEIEQCTALEILSIKGNQFTSLPKEIGLLTALKNLCLKSNQLTSLPPEIGQLKALKCLNLNGNQLTSLPSQNRTIDYHPEKPFP